MALIVAYEIKSRAPLLYCYIILTTKLLINARLSISSRQLKDLVNISAKNTTKSLKYL